MTTPNNKKNEFPLTGIPALDKSPVTQVSPKTTGDFPAIGIPAIDKQPATSVAPEPKHEGTPYVAIGENGKPEKVRIPEGKKPEDLGYQLGTLGEDKIPVLKRIETKAAGTPERKSLNGPGSISE